MGNISVGGFLHDHVQPDALAFLLALAAEGQDLLHQVLGAIGGGRDFLDIFLRGGIALGIQSSRV